MTKEEKKRRDHERYLLHREEMLAYSHEYYFNYTKKGIKKDLPRLTPEERKKRRAERQHSRYIEKRERILALQKVYRDTHKDEIKERRRKRAFERTYGKPYQ